MIADLIVWASVAFTLISVAAWAASPALRVWIERPKHRFLEAVRGYDARARPSGDGEEPKRR